MSWWGPRHDEIGLVSLTNAIRVAATGGRSAPQRGSRRHRHPVSTAGEQRTQRTLSEGPSVVVATALVDAPGRRNRPPRGPRSRPARDPPNHLGGSAWAEPPYVLPRRHQSPNPTNPEPTWRRKSQPTAKKPVPIAAPRFAHKDVNPSRATANRAAHAEPPTPLASLEPPTRLTFSVAEAAQALGVSRTLAYELARTGQLRTVKLGRRLVVPRSAVTELLERPAD